MTSFSFNATNRNVFNFNLSKAITILEEHSMNDKVFTPLKENLIIVTYAILMTAGLCSNIMVCSVVISNSKIRGSRNALVINLNVSDILFCAFCMPFTLLVLIRRSWILGNFLCKFVPYVQASTIFVSAATVSAIAIDRCKLVLSFNPHRQRYAKGEMLLNTVIIWTFSLLLSLPMFIFREMKAVGVHGFYIYNKCVEMWPSPFTKGAYTVIIVFAQFLIPALMLLVSHMQINYHLNTRVFKGEESHVNQEEINSERLKRDLLRNNRATMVLLLISIVFTISWLPWNVLNLIVDFNPFIMTAESLYLAFAICHIIAMTSAVTNPILYGWLNSNIRREMIRFGWAVAKASSSLVSSKSSQSEHVMLNQAQNTNIRSAGKDTVTNKRLVPECPV